MARYMVFKSVSLLLLRERARNMSSMEQGASPLVLLLHGFPEFWYSWRHQIAFLAKNGYHVVAPDLRGYGDSEAPLSPTSYSVAHIVGDLISILDHFGEQQWDFLCLSRPDRVKGFVSLSVPYFQRDPNARPIESYRYMFRDGFFVCQFQVVQERGRAEAALARYDYLTVMKKFLLITKTDIIVAPPGMEIIDYLETPSLLPPWITEEELQVYANKFQESGFTGAFKYYRAMDLNWELLAAWQGTKVQVPTKFIAGDKDIGFETITEYVTGEISSNLSPILKSSS